MKTTARLRIGVILVVLPLVFAMGERQIERLGDRYQVALPVLGLACAVTNGQVVDYAVRYILQQGTVNASKALFGHSAINRRPRGGFAGMPSGHTSASFYGAGYLARACVGGNVWMQGAVFATAGFVGYSRVESGAHTIIQVLIGALVGFLGDRALRRFSFGEWIAARLRRKG